MAKKAKHSGSAKAGVSVSAAPVGHGGMDEQQMIRIAKAIADPRRMALLRRIAQQTASCADLRGCISISAATLSHHMKELETAGLITTSKDGRSVSATLQKKVWKSYIGELRSLTHR